jgi:hypothetical protein
MAAHFRLRPLSFTAKCGILAALAVVIAGCGPPSAEDKLQKAFKENPNVKQVTVVPFEGTVTVDGKPPSTEDTVLLVILNDMQHLQDAKEKPKLMTGCTADGHFAFTTYNVHDGVQEGSYVVTFVQLHSSKNVGRRRNTQFLGPDLLNNLYNDPEKNALDNKFKLDIKQPGNKEANFNLEVAGKEPVTTPGPHAVTGLDTR